MVSCVLSVIGLVASVIGFLVTLFGVLLPGMLGEVLPTSVPNIVLLLIAEFAIAIALDLLTIWRLTLLNVERRMAGLPERIYFHDGNGHPAENRFDFETFLVKEASWLTCYNSMIFRTENGSHVKCKVGPYHYELYTYLDYRGDGKFVAITQYNKYAARRRKLPETSRAYEGGMVVYGIGEQSKVGVTKEALERWMEDVADGAKEVKRDREAREKRMILESWRRRN